MSLNIIQRTTSINPLNVHSFILQRIVTSNTTNENSQHSIFGSDILAHHFTAFRIHYLACFHIKNCWNKTTISDCYQTSNTITYRH